MSTARAMGYVKIHRSIVDWEWYHDDRCVRLFLHLLIKSNWTEGKWRGTPIVPGQVITSTVKLADQLGWSRSAVNRTLDKLKSTGEVDTKPDSKWTLVTVTNWAKWQDDEVKPDTKPDRRRTATGHQTGQQPDTIEEEKQLSKKEEEEKSARGGFEAFWEAYDRKEAKPDALKAWLKLSEADRTVCMAAVPAYVKSKPDKQFRPYPATFLNGRRWEDEIVFPVLSVVPVTTADIKMGWNTPTGT